MGMLGNIFGRIFHRGEKPDAGATQVATGSPASPTAPTAPSAGTPPSTGTSPTANTAPTAAVAQPVDVEAVLNEMASRNPQKLNWRTSIVDLLKLLDLDSSIQARKELADELHYSGDRNDSAAMNIWLHKQVMRKLAENGGKVPADLKD